LLVLSNHVIFKFLVIKQGKNNAESLLRWVIAGHKKSKSVQNKRERTLSLLFCAS